VSNSADRLRQARDIIPRRVLWRFFPSQPKSWSVSRDGKNAQEVTMKYEFLRGLAA